MEASTRKSLPLLSANSLTPTSINEFSSVFYHLNTLISCPTPCFPNTNPKTKQNPEFSTFPDVSLKFSSTSVSIHSKINNPEKPMFQSWLKPAIRGSPAVHALFKNLSVLERAVIGAAAGGIAGAFTYVCLHPLDTIKTKLQTKGASEIYKGAFDVIVKTFQNRGILGFYSGVSAVIVGSTFSSAVYFGTCEFGKSVLSKMGHILRC